MNEKKKRKEMFFQMAYASSLGIAMVIAIFGSLYIGLFIDRKFGTGNIFTSLFLIIGIIAGFRNFYIFIKRYMSRKDETPDKEIEGESHGEDHSSKKN
jgi:ATP synthase protein I